MTLTNLYPTQHATTGRGGVVDGQAKVVGRIGWSTPLGGTATAGRPADLLIWQGLPVVLTPDRVALFSAAGQRLWSRDKQDGTPAAAALPRGPLYFKNRALLLDAVDVQNAQVLKSASFPAAMSQEARVLGFWPRAEDFVAVVQEPEPFESRDGPPSGGGGGQLTVVRNRYPTNHGDWMQTYEGSTKLAPLLVPGKSVVAINIGAEVIRIDAARETELSRLRLPFRDVSEWSVDGTETYAIAGYEQKRKVLVALSASGATLWRWEDKSDADAWSARQPPLRLADGRVCVLTEGRVLMLESGRLAWAYDVRSEALRHGAAVGDGSFEIKDGRLHAKAAVRHATALADGSLLVTSGRTLLQLGAKGTKLWGLDLDADILSSPVVDADGKVYVATGTHLFKID